MNQFVQRVVHYVANEVLIKGLANSKTFQRFAVKTDQSLRKVREQGTEQLNQTMEELTKQQQQQFRSTTAARQPPSKPQTGFTGFVSAFFKEIRKDFAGAGSRV
jgi:hypothetical protein